MPLACIKLIARGVKRVKRMLRRNGLYHVIAELLQVEVVILSRHYRQTESAGLRKAAAGVADLMTVDLLLVTDN